MAKSSFHSGKINLNYIRAWGECVCKFQQFESMRFTKEKSNTVVNTLYFVWEWYIFTNDCKQEFDGKVVQTICTKSIVRTVYMCSLNCLRFIHSIMTYDFCS